MDHKIKKGITNPTTPNPKVEVDIPEDLKDFVPTKEDILRELRAQAKRKEYQKSPKAKEARKKYQQKRYEESKAMREYLKAHPEKKAELEAVIATETFTDES